MTENGTIAFMTSTVERNLVGRRKENKKYYHSTAILAPGWNATVEAAHSTKTGFQHSPGTSGYPYSKSA